MEPYARKSDYWKLHLQQPGLLRKRLMQQMLDNGYTDFSESGNVVTTRSRHWRMLHRRPCYHGCTVDELERFVKDRGLRPVGQDVPNSQSAPPRSPKRDRLTATLEDADDHRPFHKFNDLPPELQKLICEVYVADLLEVLATPAQPPIAHVSRDLRRIALPAFYSGKTFRLCYQEKIPLYAYSGAKPRFIMNNDERTWLSRLRSEDLASIRSLKIDFGRSWSIRILLTKKNDQGYAVEVDASRSDLQLTGPLKQVADALCARISEYVDRVEWREGRRRLKLEDIHNIRRALEGT